MRSTMTEALLAMNAWIELSILAKATIILIAGLIVARLASRASASVRHLVLAVTIATLSVLPIIGAVLPVITIEVERASNSSAQSTVKESIATLIPTQSASKTPQAISNNLWTMPSWQAIFRIAWIGGAVLFLGSLLLDLLRLRRIRSCGLPWPALTEITQRLAARCGLSRSIEVLLHEDVPAPLTCGLLRPAIVLPADARSWNEADLDRALVHELEHVRRGDWIIQVVARATCAAYWFHPLVWIVRRSLCLEAERACDDAVIQNSRPAEYAEQLVLLARRLSSAPAQPTLGMANRCDLARRVSALLDSTQRRGRAGGFMVASALGLGGLVVMAIAPVRTVALSKAPNILFARESGGQDSKKADRAPAPVDVALYEAAEKGETRVIEKLLNESANVNATLYGDGTPLIGAARAGRLEAVRLLLDRGADPNLAVSGDGNPLIMAAREGHTGVVALLLDRGAAIDQIVPGDENALIQSSGEGRLEVVKLLVTRGANVNVKAWAEGSSNGRPGEWRTPLGMAYLAGHKEVFAFLLSAGAKE
jgi:beta-lactamase regulating signal transducer with metallopeptidase domain